MSLWGHRNVPTNHPCPHSVGEKLHACPHNTGGKSALSLFLSFSHSLPLWLVSPELWGHKFYHALWGQKSKKKLHQKHNNGLLCPHMNILSPTFKSKT